MSFKVTLLAAAALIAPAWATAQTSPDDVVVMRRVLAPPQVDRDAQGYDQNQFHWETGPWTANTGCSASVQQTRAVTCVRKRQDQPDSACAGLAKPDAAKAEPEYSTCGHNWQITGHGAWSSGCSGSATRPTTSVCMRADGTQVADGKCDADTRPGPETGSNYTQCEGAWVPGEWTYQSTCAAATNQIRAVACMKGAVTLADSQCATPDRPDTQRGPYEVYYGCGYTWHLGTWSAYSSTCSATATRTRVNTCTRDAEGNPVVDNGYCVDRNGARSSSETVEIYSGCVDAVTNGGFENGLTGWSGVTDFNCANPGYGAGGSKCVGRIFQGGTGSTTLTGLIPGKTYTLVIYALGFGSWTTSMNITVDGVTKLVKAGAYGGVSANQRTATFTPTTDTTTLSIRTLDGGVYMDNISFNIVP